MRITEISPNTVLSVNDKNNTKNQENINGSDDYSNLKQVQQSIDDISISTSGITNVDLNKRNVVADAHQSTDQYYDQYLLKLISSNNTYRKLTLNEMFDLLGLELSNVPGKGDCGLWAILHSAFPKHYLQSAKTRQENNFITSWDISNLRKKIALVAKNRNYEQADEIGKNGYAIWTYELKFFANVLDRPIICFNHGKENDVAILYNDEKFFYEHQLIYSNVSDDHDEHIEISNIFAHYDEIIKDHQLLRAAKRYINTTYENPIMIYLGNGHYQSLVTA